MYWPLCFIVGGLIITGYSVWSVWVQTLRKSDNESD